MSGTKTVTLTIDGRPVTAAEGTSVLRAAGAAGIEIPHFCDHPALAPAGSCRMCLVEIEGLPKLELSCSTPVREGLVVRTDTPRIASARRDVLEFLLADHPLDCPVCDKAGECRLQDLYGRHGRFPSRFLEAKEKKAKLVPIGRGLLLDRERCILCTRCVRFLRQVTGTGELGVFERGARSEIGVFEDLLVDNGDSGNLADICPVGAITSEDFRFKTRAWFLDRRPAVCPLCSRGCAVFVESVPGYPLPAGTRRVFRITARANPAVNGPWICDLGRSGRRDVDEGRPAGPRGAVGPVLAEIAAALRAVPGPERAARIAVILNSRLTCEELALARMLFVDRLGLANIFFSDPPAGPADGLLLTGERVPNARGVVEAGFRPAPPRIEAIAGASVVLAFGPDAAGMSPAAEFARALEGVPRRVLFSARAGPLDRLFDPLVPVAVPYEKSGTYINISGLRQSFRRAVDPGPGVAAEGEVLTGLARGLGAALGAGDDR